TNKEVNSIIAENRSFYHLFGLYKPRHGQTIANLLSKGIVNEDGTPGPNFIKAAQFQVLPQASYYIGALVSAKTPYVTLPPPDFGGVSNVQRDNAAPFKTSDEIAHLVPVLTQ